MQEMLERYVYFWIGMIRCAVTGSVGYFLWLGALGVAIAAGGFSYYHDLTEGLGVTNMNDYVSWGIGIANFVFFVGIAAAAAVLVVPAYAFHRNDIKEVVLIGELLAFCSVAMCMLFIMTDIGHPERFWHLVPPLGALNLPSSLLAWDVIVFNVYLFLNLHIPGYLLYKLYLGEKPWWPLYLPFVFISMVWAVSIHTVTAFLLAGLASRAFWSSAILAPRFLISAFASGPAFLILLFSFLRRWTRLTVKRSVLDFLVKVLRVTMPINLFLFGCDFFIELYPGTSHSIHAQYLYFGINGHDTLTKAIWTAVALNVVATIIFEVKALRERRTAIFVACVMTILGIWTEKGMGLIFPGFIPSPLGELVEYLPNIGEILVSVAVFALGALMFTVMVKVSIAIQTGELRLERPMVEVMMGEARRQLSAVTRARPIPSRTAVPEVPYHVLSTRKKIRRLAMDVLKKL